MTGDTRNACVPWVDSSLSSGAGGVPAVTNACDLLDRISVLDAPKIEQQAARRVLDEFCTAFESWEAGDLEAAYLKACTLIGRDPDRANDILREAEREDRAALHKGGQA